MAPRVKGPSALIPGAYDVEDDYGNLTPIDPNTPAMADLMGRYQTEQMAAPVTQGPMVADNAINPRQTMVADLEGTYGRAPEVATDAVRNYAPMGPDPGHSVAPLSFEGGF